MKHSLFIAFFLCLGSFASAQQLTSPDGNLSLEFMEQADGVPAYRLDYKGNPRFNFRSFRSPDGRSRPDPRIQTNKP